MKKIALILLCSIFFATCSYALKNETPARKGQIGITFSSFGNNDVIQFQNLIGGASYNGDRFYTLGINYLYPLNKTFDIETGVEYSNHKIIIKPSPGMDYPPYGAQFSMISIPVTARVNFARYFFVNGGLFLDIDASNPMPVDSQTGLGANMGLGFKYNFKCGVTAFVNPYLKAHSLVPFSSANYQQHLMESGFRFGLLVLMN